MKPLRLGNCPKCPEDKAPALEPWGLHEHLMDHKAYCPRCRTVFTLGQKGTLAAYRRSKGAKTGWAIRRAKAAQKGGKRPKP